MLSALAAKEMRWANVFVFQVDERVAPRWHSDIFYGCDVAIDYKATRFEDHIQDVDVVLDPVGADSQIRSFGVLKKGGILVALTEEPRQDLAREHEVRATMIGVKADGQRLAAIGKLIDSGKLRPLLQAVLPLEQIKEALALSRSRHVAGKIVLTIGN